MNWLYLPILNANLRIEIFYLDDINKCFTLHLLEKQMIKVAVLLTCFNRAEKTLKCLELLHSQKLDIFVQEIFLVDDGSTDGTADLVRQRFPAVYLISGSGNLYWNGGMRLAWQQALTRQFDFYIWLNDDVELLPDALDRLLASYLTAESRQIIGAITGSMQSKNRSALTYGGRKSRFWWHPTSFGALIAPNDQLQECDVVNGNLTLIPAQAVERIGILSGRFTHSIGDFDYAFRLRKNGMLCYVAPGFYGLCDNNPRSGSPKDTTLSLKKRVELLQRPNKFPPYREWQIFVREHGGLVWPLLWLKSLIRGKFPYLWVLLRG